MSDEVSVEVRTADFEAGMMRLRDGVKRGFIDPQYGTFPVQGRLLAERCQAFTPPANQGQGRAAVTRDMMRVFRPLSHTTFTQNRMRTIVKTDDRPGWDEAAKHFNNGHFLQNTQAIGFSDSWHQRNRDKRGRVKGRGDLGVVTLGPEGRAARKNIEDTKKRVGWARAGWNAGILGLGGSVKQGWVSKHGTAGGGFQNATGGPDPFIRVVNSTGWARYGQGEGDRILKNAIMARSRDMEAYYQRMMEKAGEAATHGARGGHE